MVTGAEVVAALETSEKLAESVRTALARNKASWPNARDGLMELCAIVDEWCQVAVESNVAALREFTRLMRSGQSDELPSLPRYVELSPDSRGLVAQEARHSQTPIFVERITQDIDAVLRPAVPWLKRWRGSQRRAAARRTLRSMLRIYCPDLVDSFDEAVANRATLVTEHSHGFAAAFQDQQMSVHELVAILDRLDDTLRGLLAVRDDLRAFIQQHYPVL